MKFSVRWMPRAEQLLTQMWLSSRDREAIREACEKLEARLTADPLNAGESREGNYRIVFEEPLAVTFSVWPIDRLVKVVYVSRTHFRYGRS